MCGITIAKASDLKKYLLNQKDRGLDSMGFLYNGFVYKAVFKTYKEYKTYLFKQNLGEGLALMHHRKATIGSISLDNAHPFKGKHFWLMQNGTAKVFHTAHKEEHGKDVDTANLLAYIEKQTSKLDEVPQILEGLTSKFLSDDFGNIIIKHNDRVLFYSDGTRDSYIDIEGDKINSISNYKLDETKGFKNKGYIIFSVTTGLIEKNTFENINQVVFNKYSGYVTSYYGCDYSTKQTTIFPAPRTKTQGYSGLNKDTFPLDSINQENTGFIFTDERQNILYFLEIHRYFYGNEDINSGALLLDYLNYVFYVDGTTQFKEWYGLEYCVAYFNYICYQYLDLIND